MLSKMATLNRTSTGRWHVTCVLLWAILLLAVPGSADTAAGSRHLTKIRVHAVDEQGKTIKDLRQDDFILEEDGKEQAIEWWHKSNELGRVRYQLGYLPKREQKSEKHLIEVRIKRSGAIAKFTPKSVR